VAVDGEASQGGIGLVPNGMNLVLHEPEFARLWDPAYSGPMAGSTVVDVNLPSREAVDDAHARVVAAGYRSSVEPWDTFFGARYAIVCDADGHRTTGHRVEYDRRHERQLTDQVPGSGPEFALPKPLRRNRIPC